ncbi:MAG: tail fiber domain-containing protein [bacterium]
MKKMTFLIMIGFVFMMFSFALAADIPMMLNYQGYVEHGKEGNRVPFDGNGFFKFAIVDPNGNTTYWSNDGTSSNGDEPDNAVMIPVTIGVFTVKLGNAYMTNMSALPTPVFDHQNIYVRVWFSENHITFEQLAPDTQIVSAGFAYKAQTAQTAQTAENLSGVVLGIPGGVATLDQNGTIPSAQLPGISVDTEDNVGIGTKNPETKLDVFGGNLRITRYGSPTLQLNSTYPEATAYSLQTGRFSNKDFVINSTHGGDHIYINDIGNVGIGTTSPSALLDVNGKIISEDLSTKSLKTIIDTYSTSVHRKIRLNWSGGSTTNGYVGTYLITMGGRGDHQQTAFATGILTINKAYTRDPEIRFRILSGYGVYMEEEIVTDTQLVLDFHLNLSEHNKSHYSVLKISGSVGLSMDDFWSVQEEDDSEYNNGVGATMSEGVFMNGNVGIGTMNPGFKLTIDGGDIAVNGKLFTQYGDGAGEALIVGNDSKLVDINVANTLCVQGVQDTTIASILLGSEGGVISGYTGNIGIGTTSPSRKLDVAGNVIANAYENHSDSRLKKNILGIDNALDKVLALRGVEFEWRIEEYPEKRFAEGRKTGLIAQDVEQVIPEVVSTDNEGYKSVEYGKIVGVLIEAIKAQQAQIEELKARIEVLEK